MKFIMFMLVTTVFTALLRRKSTLTVEELKGLMAKQNLDVKSIIGNGNFGITFSAVDTSPANQLIVKRQKICAQHINKYIKEAKIAKQISQIKDKTGLIAPKRMFVEGDYFYYTMKRAAIDILQLADKLGKKDLFSESHFIQIAIDICSGINSLNQVGINHNDIKWANIVLNTKGRAKMIDFGEASVLALQNKDDVNKVGKVLQGLLRKLVVQGEKKEEIQKCIDLVNPPTSSLEEGITCFTKQAGDFKVLPETKAVIDSSMKETNKNLDIASGFDECVVAPKEKIDELKKFQFDDE